METLSALLEPPGGLLLQPTRLYDRNGVHILTLQTLATQEHQYLRLLPAGITPPEGIAPLPDSLVTATLAASDPDFWAHPGFPIPGLHAVYRPTLAQRLASDLLLQDEPPSLRRSLRQRLLAAQMTARYGRVRVLEWYLNSASYGHLAYGADAAARLYFGKSAAQLDLAEAAMLAGIAESPNLNPFDAPQEALARQKGVIQDMLRYRMIAPEEGIQAARQALSLRPAGPQEWSYDFTANQSSPAFLEAVLQQVETVIPRSRLERGGLKITTTLDAGLQINAVTAIQTQTARLASLTGGKPPGEGEFSEAARLLPSLTYTETFTASLAADLVVLEPRTGQILALVGQPSIDLPGSLLPGRPVGSLSSPFIYLTAFTRGLSPASLVWDIPNLSEDAAPELAGKYHGPLRLRIALANDYLNPAQSVLELIGVENVWRTAQQMGLARPGSPLPAGSAAVQSLLGEVDLVTLGQAFGTLANQGVLVGRVLQSEASDTVQGQAAQPPSLTPVVVLRVEEAGSGKVWLDWSTSQTRPILTSQLAYLMTNVLSDEPARWPSLGHPNPLEIGRPAAARLGQNAGGSSNWALGYTPQLVVGVWLGFDPAQASAPPNPRLLPEAAAGLWHAAMNFASRDLPYQTWSVPAGISAMRVCDPSGMLPTQYCPNVVEEVFAPGSEPVQADTLYQAVPINRQTGRLATVFTPLDLVEGRVFFIAPPEAQAWARSAGYPTPPELYDTVPLEIPALPGAAIDTPQMFSIVRGMLTITGTAGGEDFASYHLQAGPGLNPPRWLQIGAASQTPVTAGVLGAWDTSGLDGLHALQLLVVQKNQSLQRATLIVTIDNQPPEVEIAFPTNGMEISAGRKRIILQVNAQDNLGVQSVAFYIDEALLNLFTQPPFAAGWPLKIGDHTLRVVVTDQAGNSRQASVQFSVK